MTMRIETVVLWVGMELTRQVNESRPQCGASQAALEDSMQEWQKLHAELAVLRKEAKVRRTRMKELSTDISRVMSGHQIDRLATSQGDVCLSKQVRRESLSKRYLETQIPRYFASTSTPTAEGCLAHVLDERATTTAMSIRQKAR